MANESRIFRVNPQMSSEAIGNAVMAFLSSSKAMEVQGSVTTDGYVVQGTQRNDGWKTISGTKLAITVQLIRSDPSTLNVMVGEGQWSDKIGAAALGWFIAWPLAVTAGIGAYKQKKLPEEIFHVIENYIVTGGNSVVIQNAGAQIQEGKIVCPVCKAQCDAGSQFCNICGAKLESSCPSCGAPLKPGSKFCSQCGHQVG